MAHPYALYQAQILEHYKHPKNRGVLEPATHAGSESNPLCGDSISLTLRVDGSDRVEDVRFDGEGCAVSMASASILTEQVKGKTLAEVRALDREAVLKNLGVPLSAVREQCALLSLHVLRRALGEPKGS
ncbi:MAG TPA: SUF system NifU family Fe-S cluster assembly protein [Thermoplasmata archaeon]|nr:SUF system NifU family Fe-S cluster assembly protein [Thermoplasmata archaeon]